MQARSFFNTVKLLKGDFSTTLGGFFGAQNPAIVENLVLPLVASFHSQLVSEKKAQGMQEVSISHVYAAIILRGLYPASENFSNDIVNQCIQRGTDEVVDLLHHWTIVNSYLPYILGFFVWDMVALGLAVLYQNAREEPISLTAS